MTFNWFCNTR